MVAFEEAGGLTPSDLFLGECEVLEVTNEGIEELRAGSFAV